MFTEADLFRECAVKHSDLAPNQALGEHTYTAVWSALRGWLLALFTRCRGALFPTFARIAWHRVGDQLEGGAPMLRPIFVPSDAYLRAYLLHAGSGVVRASNLTAEELNLEPCEEYSAMKIAIKHSCSLNKDVVFCCTRHLLHQLGEALHSGHTVTVDLGVGILSGRDRCLSFRFHSQYLAHWPTTMAARLAPQARPDLCQRKPAPTLPRQHQQGQYDQQQQQKSVKLEAVRAAQGGRRGEMGSTPRSTGSGGGSSACTSDRAREESDGGQERERWRRAGGSGPASPGSPGRVEQPSSCMQQQQQQGPQGVPLGAGKDRDSWQPGREAGPPSARTRPAWGARVPPQRPTSTGRRPATAAAAATTPEQPRPASQSFMTAVNGAPEAPASPGRPWASGGPPLQPNERRYQQQQHLHHHYYLHHDQLLHKAPARMVYSPKASNSGEGYAAAINCKLGSDGGGTGAAVYEVAPVARAVPLAARTPRPRPTSLSPRPMDSVPQQQHYHHNLQQPAHSLQANANGNNGGAAAASVAAAPTTRPLSAPRCGTQSDAAATVVFAEASSRRGHVVSPRLDGAAAAVRPPWGSGYGARARAGPGDAPGPVRPRSAPRLRPSVAASTPAVNTVVAAKPAVAEEQKPLSRHAGGGGTGLDVRQLWSPDNNLTMAAAGGRETAGGGRVRRLYEGAGASPGRVLASSSGGSSQQARLGAPLRQQLARPLSRQSAQQSGASDGEEPCCVSELDDHVSSDQQKPTQRSQEEQNLEQQLRRQGARKLLFISPQEAACPAASATAMVAAGTAAAGALGGKQQPNPQPRAGGGQLQDAAAAAAGQAEGCDEPDHSPQLRRDQSLKSTGSPEHKKPVSVAQAAVAMAGGPHRTIVRTISPRADIQQHNLRYNSTGGSNTASGVSGVSFAGIDGTGQTVAAAGTTQRMDCLRLPARPSFNQGLRVTSPAAAAPAAVVWDRDAAPHMSRGTRMATLLGSPCSTAALVASPLPRTGGVSAVGVCDRSMKVATSFHGGRQGRGQTAGPRLGGGLRTGQGACEDGCSSGGGGASSGGDSGDASSGGPRNDATGGVEGMSSSGGGPERSEALDLGFPLPLYDSTTGNGSGGGGDSSGSGPKPAAAAVARYSPGQNLTEAPPTRLAITATVQAALGRHRQIGVDWLRRTEDSNTHNSRDSQSNCSGSIRNSSSGDSSLVQLVCPQPDVNFTFVPSPRSHPGPAFPVPMIITEQDLPEPAWRTDLTRRNYAHGGGSSGGQTSCSGDLASSRVSLLADDADIGEELEVKKREVHMEAGPGTEGVVACSAASSADICWSARSGRAQDSTLGIARGGALSHRRACGGAMDVQEADTQGGGTASAAATTAVAAGDDSGALLYRRACSEVLDAGCPTAVNHGGGDAFKGRHRDLLSLSSNDARESSGLAGSSTGSDGLGDGADREHGGGGLADADDIYAVPGCATAWPNSGSGGGGGDNPGYGRSNCSSYLCSRLDPIGTSISGLDEVAPHRTGGNFRARHPAAAAAALGSIRRQGTIESINADSSMPLIGSLCKGREGREEAAEGVGTSDASRYVSEDEDEDGGTRDNHNTGPRMGASDGEDGGLHDADLHSESICGLTSSESSYVSGHAYSRRGRVVRVQGDDAGWVGEGGGMRRLARGPLLAASSRCDVRNADSESDPGDGK